MLAIYINIPTNEAHFIIDKFVINSIIYLSENMEDIIQKYSSILILFIQFHQYLFQ